MEGGEEPGEEKERGALTGSRLEAVAWVCGVAIARVFMRCCARTYCMSLASSSCLWPYCTQTERYCHDLSLYQKSRIGTPRRVAGVPSPRTGVYAWRKARPTKFCQASSVKNCTRCQFFGRPARLASTVRKPAKPRKRRQFFDDDEGVVSDGGQLCRAEQRRE